MSIGGRERCRRGDRERSDINESHTAKINALAVMIGGVGLVMGMMVLMNRYTQPPAKEKPRATTRVQVKQTKPKPKKQAADALGQNPSSEECQDRHPNQSLRAVCLGSI